MKPKYSSTYWRELADDARARADEMASSRARLWMIGIARIYDQLADEAKFEGDEAYWFGKAAQLARRMAELDDGEAANTLLQVAHMYEAMAWRAAEREDV